MPLFSQQTVSSTDAVYDNSSERGGNTAKRNMPLSVSKRSKTQPQSETALINTNSDHTDTATGERKPSNADSTKRDGPKSAQLRAKASSPQLLPRGSAESNPRPGLNRNFSRSWYGTWNNKASPTSEVRRESISVARGLTSESSDLPRSDPSQYMHNSLKRPRKSIPVVAEETHVNATDIRTNSDQQLLVAKTSVTDKAEGAVESDGSERTLASASQPSELPKDDASDGTPQMKPVSGGAPWFGWWSRPDDYAPSETDKQKATGEEDKMKKANDTSLKSDQRPGSGFPGFPTTAANAVPIEPRQAESSTPKTSMETDSTPGEQSTRTWFGLWSASQNQKPPSTTTEEEASKTADITEVSDPSPVQTNAKETTAMAQEANKTAVAKNDPETKPNSSGWAFWSKDSPKEQDEDAEGTRKRRGQIAVADTPSQSHPEAAQFNQTPESKKSRQKKKPAARAAAVAKDDSVKDGRSVADSAPKPNGKANNVVKRTLLADHAFATSAKSASTTSLPLPDVPKSEESKKEDAKLTPATKALKAQQQRPNIIEPQFASTYPKAQVPTYWETLGYYFTYSFGLAATNVTSAQHVMVAPHKPKVKNAIAIGVHGYFPAPLVQKIIGQPTGTSIKFATHAAAAIRSWVDKNQPDTPCEIEQVALEGEGFISDRVGTLWKLLLNWLTHIRNADLILVAAHSQGVPVAVMLVAKLIQLGCLNPNAKLGICAMAGVNLGPFADYKSRFFGGSALELFDFSHPESKVSREYSSAIDVVLRHGVRITYVGSLDDQLVSLESSLFSNLTHPYVHRAVFVDGRLHAPDFITHLVAFTLRLRNLGVPDHGLIRELSSPLAGSIYGGEGHSRVYDDDAVYALALQFALETTDVDPKTYARSGGGSGHNPKERRGSIETRRSLGGVPHSTGLANSIRRGSISASIQPGIAPFIASYEIPASGAAANPYFLPWAMRGILEEVEVRGHMQGEVKELVRLFDEWKPTSKALKDVKFRLEAVKSKL